MAAVVIAANEAGLMALPSFGDGMRAPKKIDALGVSFSDTAPAPPPLSPVLDIAALNARMQGVAVRCYTTTTSIYVPFLALTANGQLYRGLPLTGTQIVIYKPSGEGAPGASGATVRRNAVSGDFLELDPVYLPGAYALKLVSGDLNAAGFLRYAVNNPNIISISGAVQIDTPPSSGGGEVDLGPLQTTADNIYSNTQVLLSRGGIPEAQLSQIAAVLAEVINELNQTQNDLLTIPTALNLFRDTLLGSWDIDTDNHILVYRDSQGAPTQAYELYDDQNQLNSRKVFKRVVIPESEWTERGIT